MSYLPELYRERNFLDGHARSCAWGAGADCTCGVHPEMDEPLSDSEEFVFEALHVEFLLKAEKVVPVVEEDDDLPF